VASTQDAQQGGWSADEFDALYRAWSDRLYRYAVHLTGRGPIADDLFQETWLKAIEHAGQLRDAELFGPWLLRIARNLAYNYSRQGRRKASVWIFSNLAAAEGSDGEAELLGRHADGRPDPRQRAIDAERRQILRETLEAIEPDTQEMLQLKYFEGMTLAEVAAIMNLPPGTVSTRVYRALKTIRANMERQGFPSMGAL
jgi:RNA polymerase sigma-70 factor (ECF subfamily)